MGLRHQVWWRAALSSVALGMVVVFCGNGCVTTRSGNPSLPTTPPGAPTPSARSHQVHLQGVLLDAGHGGEPEEAAARSGENYASLGKTARQVYHEQCFGAISAEGYKEKTATLAVAKKVESLLRKAGIQTAMTRTTDSYVPLNERAARMLEPEYRGWIFVSIHFNRSSRQQDATNLSAKYEAARGFEIYVSPSRRGSRSATPVAGGDIRTANRLLASSIQSHLDDIPGMANRGIKEAWFLVLRSSPLPAVLIEGGFLSNPEEAILISTEDYQWELARATVAGIQDYASRPAAIAKSAPSGPSPR